MKLLKNLGEDERAFRIGLGVTTVGDEASYYAATQEAGPQLEAYDAERRAAAAIMDDEGFGGDYVGYSRRDKFKEFVEEGYTSRNVARLEYEETVDTARETEAVRRKEVNLAQARIRQTGSYFDPYASSLTSDMIGSSYDKMDDPSQRGLFGVAGRMTGIGSGQDMLGVAMQYATTKEGLQQDRQTWAMAGLTGAQDLFSGGFQQSMVQLAVNQYETGRGNRLSSDPMTQAYGTEFLAGLSRDYGAVIDPFVGEVQAGIDTGAISSELELISELFKSMFADVLISGKDAAGQFSEIKFESDFDNANLQRSASGGVEFRRTLDNLPTGFVAALQRMTVDDEEASIRVPGQRTSYQTPHGREIDPLSGEDSPGSGVWEVGGATYEYERSGQGDAAMAAVQAKLDDLAERRQAMKDAATAAGDTEFTELFDSTAWQRLHSERIRIGKEMDAQEAVQTVGDTVTVTEDVTRKIEQREVEGKWYTYVDGEWDQEDPTEEYRNLPKDIIHGTREQVYDVYSGQMIAEYETFEGERTLLYQGEAIDYPVADDGTDKEAARLAELAQGILPDISKDSLYQLIADMLSAGIDDPLVLIKGANDLLPDLTDQQLFDMLAAMISAGITDPLALIAGAQALLPNVSQESLAELLASALGAGIKDPLTLIEATQKLLIGLTQDQIVSLLQGMIDGGITDPLEVLTAVDALLPKLTDIQIFELMASMMDAGITDPLTMLAAVDALLPKLTDVQIFDLMKSMLDGGITDPLAFMKAIDDLLPKLVDEDIYRLAMGMISAGITDPKTIIEAVQDMLPELSEQDIYELLSYMVSAGIKDPDVILAAVKALLPELSPDQLVELIIGMIAKGITDFTGVIEKVKSAIKGLKDEDYIGLIKLFLGSAVSESNFLGMLQRIESDLPSIDDDTWLDMIKKILLGNGTVEDLQRLVQDYLSRLAAGLSPYHMGMGGPVDPQGPSGVGQNPDVGTPGFSSGTPGQGPGPNNVTMTGGGTGGGSGDGGDSLLWSMTIQGGDSEGNPSLEDIGTTIATIIRDIITSGESASAKLDSLQIVVGDMPESEETVANMLQRIIDGEGTAVLKVEAIGIAIGAVEEFDGSENISTMIQTILDSQGTLVSKTLAIVAMVGETGDSDITLATKVQAIIDNPEIEDKALAIAERLGETGDSDITLATKVQAIIDNPEIEDKALAIAERLGETGDSDITLATKVQAIIDNPEIEDKAVAIAERLGETGDSDITLATKVQAIIDNPEIEDKAVAIAERLGETGDSDITLATKVQAIIDNPEIEDKALAIAERLGETGDSDITLATKVQAIIDNPEIEDKAAAIAERIGESSDDNTTVSSKIQDIINDSTIEDRTAAISELVGSVGEGDYYSLSDKINEIIDNPDIENKIAAIIAAIGVVLPGINIASSISSLNDAISNAEQAAATAAKSMGGSGSAAVEAGIGTPPGTILPGGTVSVGTIVGPVSGTDVGSSGVADVYGHPNSLVIKFNASRTWYGENDSIMTPGALNQARALYDERVARGDDVSAPTGGWWRGGFAQATSGGHTVNIAEMGEGEAILPISKVPEIFAQAFAKSRSAMESMMKTAQSMSMGSLVSAMTSVPAMELGMSGASDGYMDSVNVAGNGIIVIENHITLEMGGEEVTNMILESEEYARRSGR